MRNISYKIIEPSIKPIGVIQLLHGMAEHKERYYYFMEQLAADGFVCVIHDHLGHGEDEIKENFGYFGHDRGYKNLIADAHDMTLMMKERYPDLPYFLFGHSMGSIVARSYLKRFDEELDGLILCGAPCYNSLSPLARNLAHLLAIVKGEKSHSKLLDELFLGNFNKSFSNKNAWLSKNEENVEEYNNDPLCGFSFTCKGYEDLAFGLMDMHDLVRWKLTKSDLPILLVAGSDDPCIGKQKGLEDTINTLHEAGYSKVKHILYSKLRHEILNEVEKDEVINDIKEWLSANLID